MKSLAARYLLLQHRGSPIRLGRVHFPGQSHATVGLFATQAIPASTEILETCGSMSLDQCMSGISVILPTMSQRGVSSQRLILGPFRFANHDCNPNSHVHLLLFPHHLCAYPMQLQAIPNSNAYIITTILPVDADEEITVSYGDDYFKGNCKCETCTGTSTRVTKG